MRRRRAHLFSTILLAVGAIQLPHAQSPADQPVFRSAVEMVSMAAVVRDKRGRVIASLSRDDFEVLDAGQRRPIVDLQSDGTAPASVALLIDGSGSMRVGATADAARRVADQILASLRPDRDNAALFSFDSRLIELHEFTGKFDAIRAEMSNVDAFGTTSLYDAIAGTAGRIAKRTRNRRAVVVLTDGADTSSTYTPEEVSAIASAIDVPVYVFALTAPTDPRRGAIAGDGISASDTEGPLADLARWTGGEYFEAIQPALVLAATRRLLEELRHQYLIAFEPAGASGWRHVEIRTRRRGLTVRSRNWYLAGSSN
jgi:Ca-activated chloride channel family protein